MFCINKFRGFRPCGRGQKYTFYLLPPASCPLPLFGNSCGAIQVADWSTEIVPGQDIGIKLQAVLGWMNNYGHLPYEKQQEFLRELGGIEIGLGTLVNTNERIENAIAPSIKELQEWIEQTQPNIHVDETPWIVKGVKEWLWIFANTNFAFFHAADTRGRAELISILVKKAGGRRQEAGGIPINKFRGFNQDAVFLALRVSKYMFLCFA